MFIEIDRMELGYFFYPSRDPQALGFSRLDINLYDAPTHEHIDPHMLELVVVDPHLGIRRAVFSHPVDRDSYQVCIGRITLTDFRQNEVEAFCFGGQIKASNFSDHSYCSITSDAPIFHITRFDEDETFLVSEYESELARLQAQWDNSDQDLCQQLHKFEPTELFEALTGAIDRRIHEISRFSYHENHIKKQHAIHAAIRFVYPSGFLADDATSIEDLFKR